MNYCWKEEKLKKYMQTPIAAKMEAEDALPCHSAVASIYVIFHQSIDRSFGW